MISGFQFRKLADFCIDDEKSSTIDASKVKNGSIIYVKVDFLGYFFHQIFPKIASNIVLISHNGDLSAPGAFADKLDDPKLICWYGQNCDFKHDKFIPIPIGIANPEWNHGRVDILEMVMRKPQQKKNKIYVNFSQSTNPDRKKLFEVLQAKQHSWIDMIDQPNRSFEDYLTEMSQYRFVLSPHGNGLDCHRTWEALMLGCIPIVKTSTLDKLYKGLPVIILDEWTDLNINILDHTIYARSDFRKKLTMSYWSKKIKTFKCPLRHLSGCKFKTETCQDMDSHIAETIHDDQDKCPNFGFLN